MGHINQTANYLGARLGSLGFIVTRKAPTDNIIRKTYTVFNDSQGQSRKIILILNDKDLADMLRNKDSGQNRTPSQYVQQIYRTFRTKCQ